MASAKIWSKSDILVAANLDPEFSRGDAIKRPRLYSFGKHPVALNPVFNMEDMRKDCKGSIPNDGEVAA